MILSLKEAAEFLGLSVPAVKYHLYAVGDLLPDGRLGRSLYFLPATLREFQSRKRKPGRPRKTPQDAL